MNRRGFLRSLFASTATIVVAPAAALEALDALVPSTRTYVDMGRDAAPEGEIDRLIREVRPYLEGYPHGWSANDLNYWRIWHLVRGGSEA